MQNGDEVQASTENTKKPEVINKQYFRLKVWRHLESNGLAMFPRPVYNRIPNYKGAQEAADRLGELDIFKNATTVKVNPEKPQEPVRVLCLEKQKTLYVPVPRQASGFLSRVELPEGETEINAIRKAVSKNGMETYGKAVGIEETVILDLVVMGSVAVSKEGYRIGKGRGYGDLEFGLMMHMKTIKPDTIVVTTVHDCQVFDTLPAELFGPHDVPIDLIVTPTQVIETQRMSQRPVGILWHLLSMRRLSMMPILGQLRDVEMLAGRVCTLKEVDTDIEDRSTQRSGRRVRRRTRSHKSQSEGEPAKYEEVRRGSGNTTEGEEGKAKPRRPRRRNSHKSTSKDDKEGKEEGKEGKGKAERKRNKRPKPIVDFSVKISNISPNTRVRDLKQALSERGVKPQIMVWKGFRGFCYLHFLKPNPMKGEGDNAPTLSIESVLESLKEMSLGGSGVGAGGEEPEDKPRLLSVEPAPPRQPPAPATEELQEKPAPLLQMSQPTAEPGIPEASEQPASAEATGTECDDDDGEYGINFNSPIYAFGEKSQKFLDTSEVEVGWHNETAAYMHGRLRLLQPGAPRLILVIILLKETSNNQYDILFSNEICDLCAEFGNTKGDYWKYLKHFDVPSRCPVEPGIYEILNFCLDTQEYSVKSHHIGNYEAQMVVYEQTGPGCQNREELCTLKMDLVIDRVNK